SGARFLRLFGFGGGGRLLSHGGLGQDAVGSRLRGRRLRGFGLGRLGLLQARVLCGGRARFAGRSRRQRDHQRFTGRRRLLGGGLRLGRLKDDVGGGAGACFGVRRRARTLFGLRGRRLAGSGRRRRLGR